MSTEQKTIIADEQIVELYWQRDDRAIKLTDEKYGQLLFRIAYNILRDRLDCEECQNDTYLGIWNAIPPNRPSVFSTFIIKIMRNTALKKYEERKAKKLHVNVSTVHREIEKMKLGLRSYLERNDVNV